MLRLVCPLSDTDWKLNAIIARLMIRFLPIADATMGSHQIWPNETLDTTNVFPSQEINRAEM